LFKVVAGYEGGGVHDAVSQKQRSSE
jgi:hypothetical protein